MGRLKNRTDYENLRNARILENQARLAALGLQKTIFELRSLTSSAKSVEKGKIQKKNCVKRIYETSNLRRSNRLKHFAADSMTIKAVPYRRSDRLRGKYSEPTSLNKVKGSYGDNSKEENLEEEMRPANAPLLKVKGLKVPPLSPEASARRCDTKGRGSIYDPVLGICCHFCRQKKLCGEEDCKRCSSLDPDQPCMGKTDCSVCHSTNGVFCRACLKVRYGEEMEEVRENKEWMCPHCIEEKGINPFWICNSSICLKKRKMAPTGLAIYRALDMGYKSVAHLLMDELKRRNKVRSL
ncbi:cell division cycle-associated 7-like protein [Ricinus communis]|uniref:cell division cycle-associated 7-like protein n=1 Tax=Ricinus communis TaxID=3988 RepID=UPI00077254A0|nr:cell division cycle-associated 7-like protein [Ricinus communis]|eukprot:XP_015581102.1 cell division cycle-associated 7-like protein [Ricinus communis]